MAVRRINFMSVPVADQDRALAFYTGQLGFEVVVDAPYADEWRWIFLALPETQTRLHFARASDLSWTDGMPALTLVVDNVDEEAARLGAAGVTITAPPQPTPWAEGVRFAMIRDSENNVILMESATGGQADG